MMMINISLSLWEDEKAGTDLIPNPKLREQEHNALLV
jgi:hypothetical protein